MTCRGSRGGRATMTRDEASLPLAADKPQAASRSPHIHLHDAALPLHRDHALLELLEQRARVRHAVQVELRRRLVVRDDGDCPDAEQTVEERLVELDVLDMP